MPENNEQFLHLAAQALSQYPIEPTDIHFVRHSENVTFQVSDSQQHSFLLRIHQPRTQTFVGLRQQPAAITSELCWLEALARDTGLAVQQPLRNREGALVSLIPRQDGTLLPCSVLTWLDGTPFDPEAAQAELWAERLGQLLATLHGHVAVWDPPSTFVRPSYGEPFFAQLSADLAAGVQLGVIAEDGFALIRETLAIAGTTMRTLKRTREHWGLIHNDLHPANCLVSGERLSPIDFSLSGFSYVIFDLATSLGSLPVALRTPLLQAYRRRRKLPADHIRLIEAGFIVSRLSAYAFALPDAAQHPWLRRRIPQVLETICRPFLAGSSFLFMAR